MRNARCGDGILQPPDVVHVAIHRLHRPDVDYWTDSSFAHPVPDRDAGVPQAEEDPSRRSVVHERVPMNREYTCCGVAARFDDHELGRQSDLSTQEGVRSPTDFGGVHAGVGLCVREPRHELRLAGIGEAVDHDRPPEYSVPGRDTSRPASRRRRPACCHYGIDEGRHVARHVPRRTRSWVMRCSTSVYPVVP